MWPPGPTRLCCGRTGNARQVLWDEAIRLGSQHWLVGAGAGVTILGNSHAHNLVLHYFRGIGVFGAMVAVDLIDADFFTELSEG